MSQYRSDSCTQVITSICELYDSSISCYILSFHDHFTSYQAILLYTITAIDKRVFYAVGIGNLKIEVPNNKCPISILLKDILYAPNMGITIVSINCIAKAGNIVTFKNNICKIQNKSNKVIGTIPASQNGLYKIKRIHVGAASNLDEHVNLAMLHCYLAHISPDSI